MTAQKSRVARIPRNSGYVLKWILKMDRIVSHRAWVTDKTCDFPGDVESPIVSESGAKHLTVSAPLGLGTQQVPANTKYQ